MLLLVFHAGGERYVCRCDHISEIIPQVAIKPIFHMPEFIKGSINIGGKPIPVIDWCRLVLDRPSGQAMHTRIILFRFFEEGKEIEFGLMAEKVTKTIDAPLEKFVEGEIVVKDAPYLGGIMSDGKNTIQFVKAEKLQNSFKDYLYGIA